MERASLHAGNTRAHGYPGAFVAVEGPDGVGKSTLVRTLAGLMSGLGLEIEATREPTDGLTGRRIREAAEQGERFDPETEIGLFYEDRLEHLERWIVPALKAGWVVITDRYAPSTVAYQGSRPGADRARLRREMEAFLQPDLTVILDLEWPYIRARLEARAECPTAFEEREALYRVLQAYREMRGPRIVTLDASLSPAELAGAVVRELAQRRPDWAARLGLGAPAQGDQAAVEAM